VSAGAGSASNDRHQPPPADAPATALVRGELVGRYIVLGLLGKGGMGVVYSAYDPELDRKVALKLLRVPTTRRKGEDVDAKRMRLLREAKAIARLSHPSVVVVYDVGTWEDQVFIAMELVDGLTIPRWRDTKKPKWRDILRVFIDAGEGIAAAHAADLIHRDLKPENFMVTREGKVRVMDFGLARQIDRVSDEMPYDSVSRSGEVVGAVPTDGDGDTMPGTRPPESRLTHEGNVVGTPAYMPPEQYLGVTDERSDQFSFCVSLYEMIYGQHPFEAKTSFGLTGNVQAGRVHEAPPGAKVPFWVRKILLRGLRPRPEDRFASMPELLAALRKDPSIVRKRWLIACGVFAVAGGLAFGFQRATDAKRAFCSAGPEKLSGAWELGGGRNGVLGARHEAVKRAFLATGKPYAPDAIRGVTKLLDDYAGKWVGLYKDACEATHVRGEQSAELLDLRMSCLNERLGGLRALTDVFATASGEVVEHAVDAAHALTPLDGCSDVKQLRSLIPPPDPAVKVRVEQLRRELAKVKAVHDAGKYVPALEALQPIVKDSRDLGYRALEAEALIRTGSANAELGHYKEAESALDDGLRAILSSRHDDLLPEFAAWQIWVVGSQGRFAEAEHWMKFADSVIERIGGRDSLMYSWILNNMGGIYYYEERYAQSLEYQTRAKEVKERLLGKDDPDYAGSVSNVALAMNKVGRHEEALRLNDLASGIQRRALGDAHPTLASNLNNRGEILLSLGKFEQALGAYREASRIWEREFGPESSSMAYSLTGSGMALTALGKKREAAQLLERALRIRQKEDPDPGRLAETKFALAQSLSDGPVISPRAMSLAKAAMDDLRHSLSSGERLAEISTWLAKHDTSGVVVTTAPGH
jgi:tetratricopeptide (TPR) repeat protein/tRNA A-37 threonylcarbamoyl transferase component Bud32